MATTYTNTTESWTGKYGSTSKTFCGWLEYTENISDTAVTITINGYGVENLSKGTCTWQQGAANFSITDSGNQIGTTLNYTKNLSSSNMITFTGAPKQNVFTLANYTAKTCTYARGTSAYNVTITYRVWNTTTYWKGDKSSTVTIVIPALPSKTISYNANGGSGTVSAQTKFLGVNLKLATGGFTRTNHTLLGWNTSATNTSTSAYGLGASYTTDPSTNMVLYANWRQNYVAPRITGLKAYRVELSTGNTFYPPGAYVYVEFTYSAGTLGGTALTPTSATITLGSTTRTKTLSSNTGTVALGTSSLQNIPLSISSAATITVKVTDSTGSTTATTTIPKAQFPIALVADGTAMGIMHIAERNKALVLTDGTYIDGNLQVTSINGVTVGSSPKFTDNNTTYSAATTSTAGLMSAADKTKLSAIGTIKTATLTAAKAISAYTSSSPNVCNLCSLSLEAGKWIILGVINFPDPGSGSAANNFRRAIIGDSDSAAGENFVQVHALGDYYTNIQVTRIVDISATKTFYLNAMSKQSGTLAAGTVDVYNFMKAIRIG